MKDIKRKEKEEKMKKSKKMKLIKQVYDQAIFDCKNENFLK